MCMPGVNFNFSLVDKLKKLNCLFACCQSHRTETTTVATVNLAGAVLNGSTIVSPGGVIATNGGIIFTGPVHITPPSTPPGSLGGTPPRTDSNASSTIARTSDLAERKLPAAKAEAPPAKPERRLSNKKEAFMAKMPKFLELLTDTTKPVEGELFERRVRDLLWEMRHIDKEAREYADKLEDDILLGIGGMFIRAYGDWNQETEDFREDVLTRYEKKCGGDLKRLRESEVPEILDYAVHLACTKDRLQEKKQFLGFYF